MNMCKLKMLTIEEPESNTNANAISFDQDAVTNWVQLCETNGALQANGASPEEISTSHLNVIMGLVNLVAPSMNNDETMALLTLLLLQNDTHSPVHEDPIPNISIETTDSDSDDLPNN